MTALVEVRRLGEVLDFVQLYIDPTEIIRQAFEYVFILLVTKGAVFWHTGHDTTSPQAHIRYSHPQDFRRQRFP